MIFRLAQLLDRYEKEILPEKRSFYAVKSQIKIINRLIGKYTLKEVTTHILTENLVKKRPVAGQTVRKDLSLIQRVLNTAIKDWGIHLPQGNPVTQMRLPKLPPGRDRRLQDDEEERLLHALGPMPEVHSIVQLALETAMRRGG
jgi:hypothetical protein